MKAVTREVLLQDLKTLSSMRKITLYRDDSTVQVVFEKVKHFFWTANNTVLVIAQYVNHVTGEHKYTHWPRERFCWFKDERML